MKTLSILLKVNLAAIIIAAFTFGCENVTNPEPINAIDTTKTATITGAAFADLDLNEPGNEPAPSGVKVKVILDSGDFVGNFNPGVKYQKLTYTTTLNASGKYSFEVPALDEPVSAQIFIDSFTEGQVQLDDTEIERTYTASSTGYAVSIVAGLTTVAPNIVYVAN